MIAILESYRAGLFGKKANVQNLVAGIIVGIVAMPLAMAFAIASGVKPEQGLYTAIIAALVVGLFGGTRVQIAGPTGAFIVILASITARYGIEGLQIATFMAGIILVLMGLAKLGNVIKFIPDPVIVGFTSGIAVIIFLGQWDEFLGIRNLPNAEYFHEKLINLLQALPDFHPTTTVLGLLALALTLFASRIPFLKHVPSPFTALVVITSLQATFEFQGVATIGSAFGSLPQSLPAFHFPDLSWKTVTELIGPAFTIALLGAIESLLSAMVADGMSGTRHRSNQELMGQGLANIICPLFGGFAATGAIARTATSIRNGGTSPLAAIIHSLTLLIMLLVLAPLAGDIPLCALAAILFVVAYNMSEMHHFYFMLRHAPRSDILILVVTFLLTIFGDLVIAVNVGVVLAMVLFTQRMSQAVTVDQEMSEDIQEDLRQAKLPALPPHTFIYSIQGPFFFAAAEVLERTLDLTHTDPSYIIFRLKFVPFMDVTGLQTFREVILQLKKRGIGVYLCEANGRVQRKLEKMDVLKEVQGGHVFKTLSALLKKLPANR